jgi:hypothetical protein
MRKLLLLSTIAAVALPLTMLVSAARADVIDFSSGSNRYIGGPGSYTDNNLQVTANGFLYNPPTVNYLGFGLWNETSATANGIGVAYFGAAGTLLADTDHAWSATNFPLSVLWLDLGSPGAEARQLPLELTLNSVSGNDNFTIYETNDAWHLPTSGPDLSTLTPLASGQVGLTPLSLSLGTVTDEYLLITTNLMNPTEEVQRAGAAVLGSASKQHSRGSRLTCNKRFWYCYVFQSLKKARPNLGQPDSITDGAATVSER